MKTARDIRVRTLTAGEFAEIALIRGQLEGLAVERFAGRMTSSDLEELTRLEHEHRAALAKRDYPAAMACDRRFMFTIFEAVGMPMLLETLDRLWLVARPTVGLLYSDAGVARADQPNRCDAEQDDAAQQAEHSSSGFAHLAVLLHIPALEEVEGEVAKIEVVNHAIPIDVALRPVRPPEVAQELREITQLDEVVVVEVTAEQLAVSC